MQAGVTGSLPGLESLPIPPELPAPADQPVEVLLVLGCFGLQVADSQIQVQQRRDRRGYLGPLAGLEHRFDLSPGPVHQIRIGVVPGLPHYVRVPRFKRGGFVCR